MRLRVPALMAALFLLAALPGTAGARGGDAARSEHDRILAYWTPARIASAKPRDYVMTPAGHLVPAAKPPGTPGGGGGGGGGGGTVTGKSWTGSGAIEIRSGRVLFSDADGSWICSASAISDGSATDSYSLVLTAGHCAFDGHGGWASNWLYIPDFDDAPTYSCDSTAYGCWTARALALSSAFVSGGGFGNDTIEYDWAIAVVGPGGHANGQLDALGSYQLRTSGNTGSTTAWPFGYPAAGKYKGNDLVYCRGGTVDDPYGADTWGVACDMTGGSSGGPWLVETTNPADGSGRVASLNSYGYSGLKYMFGPRFNADTQAVYNAANVATPDQAGIDHIVVP
jgi:V8-like Glu-specific endopeptidase